MEIILINEELFRENSPIKDDTIVTKFVPYMLYYIFNLHQTTTRFTDDFIVCPDREVGFIARVYSLSKSRREEFDRMLDAMPEYERHNRYLFASIGYAVIVLEVLHMFYQPVAHINRLQPLMRKALRAYICGESAAVNGDGTPYDEQIAADDELVRTMESQYDRLVDMNGKEVADRRLAATRAAANSLRLLKKIIKSE